MAGYLAFRKVEKRIGLKASKMVVHWVVLMAAMKVDLMVS